VPGDQLQLEATVLNIKRGIGKYAVVARVDGQIACEAEIMCAQREV